MCEHEFEGKDRIIANQGIVSVIYKCNKCGEEFDQCIGETWTPDKNGDF